MARRRRRKSSPVVNVNCTYPTRSNATFNFPRAVNFDAVPSPAVPFFCHRTMLTTCNSMQVTNSPSLASAAEFRHDRA